MKKEVLENQLKRTQKKVDILEKMIEDKTRDLYLSQREIEKRNEFLSVTIESLPHPFFVIDVNDYTIKLANSKTGYDPKTGESTCHALTHDRDKPCSSNEHPCPLEQVKQNKELTKVDHIHYDDDGKPRNVEIYGSPVFDDDGNVVQMAEYILDVTERKKAQGAFKQQKDFVDNIVKTANTIILTLDKEANITTLNDYGLLLTGYKKEDVIGNNWIDMFIPEEERKVLHSVFKDVFYGKNLHWGHENLIVCHDGTQRLISWQNSLLQDKTGHTLGVLSIGSDITEKSKMEGALKDSEERLKTILNRLQAGVMIVNSNTFEIADINPKAAEMIGLPKDKIVGKNCHKFVCPAEECACPIADLGQTVDNSERVLVKADGDTIPILKTVVPMELNGQDYFVESFVDITERKLAEQALESERTQLLSIFDSIDEIIYVSDPNTYEILYANKSLKDAFQTEIVGGVCFKELQGLDSPCEFCTNEIILKHKPAPYRWEYHNPILDRDYDVVDRIIKWPDGRDVRFELAIDITERKLAEKKLKDSERRFEDIALSSADWIWEIDKNGQYVFASGQIKRILGYEPEEIIGKTPFDLMPKADAKRTRDLFNENVINKKPIIDLENWNITKTGKKICLLTNGVPILDEKNNLLGYRGVDKDITAQKTAEEVARKAQLVQKVLYQITRAASTERSLMDLFKAIHNHLTTVIDTTNFYIAFYSAEEDLVTFPYFVDEMDEPPTTALPIGKGLTAYLLHEGKSLYLTKKNIKKLAQTGKIAIVGTISERWLGVPLKVKNQNVGAIVVQSYKDPDRYSEKDLEILEFISDKIANAIVHKQAEEALQQSEERYRILAEHLDQANNMKELLLDVITHDLKNPAGVISGMAEIVVDENPEDEMLQLIKDSSDSLLKVIDNASVLAKVTLEEGIEKEELDLVKMIKKMKSEFKSPLKNAGMNLECELPDKLIIKANPILAEVFKNYISNAIKYAHAGKKIIIDDKKEANRVIVNVMDFGQSIPTEEYENIFKRNIQLSKEKRRGRGLGLAIVKRIAEAHDAEVGVKPNEPTGNIFYIKIPQ